MTAKSEPGHVTAYALRRFNNGDANYAKGDKLVLTQGEFDEFERVGLVGRKALEATKGADPAA